MPIFHKYTPGFFKSKLPVLIALALSFVISACNVSHNDNGNFRALFAVITGASDSQKFAAQTSGTVANCTLTISPGTSFEDAFAQLSSGDTLCLNDGVYVQAMDIPGNMHVRAINDGMAEIDGQSKLGVKWTGGLLQMHGSNSSVRGLRVHHAGNVSDACNISGTNNTMQVMSCSHGGSHKHKIPLKVTGSGHLIEDSWFYGEGRHITQAFYASDITFRRIVARPGLAVSAGSSEPRSGNVLYSTDSSIVESSIVLDGATQSVTRYYRAFSVAAHNVNGNVNPPSNNKWLGLFAINMPDGSDGSFGAGGIGIDPDFGVGGAFGLIENLTVRGANNGLFIQGGATNYTVRDCSLNGLSGPDVTIGNIPRPTTTVTNCNQNGAEVPAKRYVNGVKTQELLFPFPNEDLIKRDMCAAGERQSDWCLSDKTLSEYVLGSALEPPENNEPPTVDSGPDQTVAENVQVTLNAAALDADGTIDAYAWRQTGGESLTLNGAATPELSFTAPVLETATEIYTFEVTVTDNKGATAVDSVNVIVQSSGDTADCSVTINPGDSFATAFNGMNAGDTLCLNDGVYVQAMDIPGNMHVRAVHDGMAEIDGQSRLGVEWSGGLLQMHGNNSSVRGLRVHHAGRLSNACDILGTNNTMRVMSCSHGGSHKHKIPLMIGGSGHLIEDSWFYGEGRHQTEAFYATDITFRRIVARPGLAVSAGSSEPRTGNVLYSTDHSIVENSIVLDGATQSVTRFYKGFSTGGHNVNGKVNPPNYNKWLGLFVINMPDGSDGSYGARGLIVDPDAGVGGHYGLIENLTVRGAYLGIYIMGGATNFTVRNCSLNQLIGAPYTIGSIPRPTTTVTNCNESGAEVPARRYVDGVKTEELLFPFPNEGLIKRDMCAAGERQSDWCLTNKTLSEYVQGE